MKFYIDILKGLRTDLRTDYTFRLSSRKVYILFVYLVEKYIYFSLMSKSLYTFRLSSRKVYILFAYVEKSIYFSLIKSKSLYTFRLSSRKVYILFAYVEKSIYFSLIKLKCLYTFRLCRKVYTFRLSMSKSVWSHFGVVFRGLESLRRRGSGPGLT